MDACFSFATRPEFYARHSVFYPGFSGSLMTANVGWLGLQHVLKSGGSGYFPMRIVESYLTSKLLHLVKRAPEFRMPAYVVFPIDHDRKSFGSALALMHRLAGAIRP